MVKELIGGKLYRYDGESVDFPGIWRCLAPMPTPPGCKGRTWKMEIVGDRLKCCSRQDWHESLLPSVVECCQHGKGLDEVCKDCWPEETLKPPAGVVYDPPGLEPGNAIAQAVHEMTVVVPARAADAHAIRSARHQREYEMVDVLRQHSITTAGQLRERLGPVRDINCTEHIETAQSDGYWLSRDWCEHWGVKNKTELCERISSTHAATIHDALAGAEEERDLLRERVKELEVELRNAAIVANRFRSETALGIAMSPHINRDGKLNVVHRGPMVRCQGDWDE